MKALRWRWVNPTAARLDQAGRDRARSIGCWVHPLDEPLGLRSPWEGFAIEVDFGVVRVMVRKR